MEIDSKVVFDWLSKPTSCYLKHSTLIWNCHNLLQRNWEVQPRKKKSEISADFSMIFRFSVGVEKKIHGKNRDFSIYHLSISALSLLFPQKNMIFSRNLLD